MYPHQAHAPFIENSREGDSKGTNGMLDPENIIFKGPMGCQTLRKYSLSGTNRMSDAEKRRRST
jgi:hypothetical protein